MTKTVSCPTCAAPVVWSAHSPWRPFCSERCKQIDLGAWASDAYRVAGRTDDGGRLHDDDDAHAPR